MDFIYIDCFSGLSGDMFLAALLDLGFPLDQLQEYLVPMGLKVNISAPEVTVQGIKSRRFLVQDSAPQFRNLDDIRRLIDHSSIPSDIACDALAIMELIAAAEARVHGIPVQSVHFHEIGAADTIIDVVGVLLALKYFEIHNLYSAPLPWSQGFINISHGRYPCPAPATAFLLQGLPCSGSSANIELVTPTGAAIIKYLNPTFGLFPESIPLQVSYGAGTLSREDSVPNLLRLVAGQLVSPTSPDSDLVAVLETQIDDMSPEFVSYLFELLLAHSSVLDVYTTPVQMKKNRTGLLLTVLSRPEAIYPLISLIMDHSTTLGVRYSIQSRLAASRRVLTVPTPYGNVRVKESTLLDGSLRYKPEFDDCKTIARENNLPLAQVFTLINQIIGQSRPG